MLEKWSQFTNVGNMEVGDALVGLRSGANVEFDFPSTGFNDSYGNVMLSYISLATSGTSNTNFPYIVAGKSGNIEFLSDVVFAAGGQDNNVNIRIEPKGVGNLTLSGSLIYIGVPGTQPIYGISNATNLLPNDPQHLCSTTYAVKSYIDTIAASLVDSVSGILNRITISGTASNPIVDISSSYVGQSTITTLGTVSSGIWNASLLIGQYGGTGVNNSGKTITLGGNLITSGAFISTFTMTNTTSVTFPTAGTLAIAAGLTSGITPTTGNIGEELTSTISSGSAVSLTTATVTPITSLAYTAGNWLVIANPTFSGSGITATELQSFISTASGTSTTGQVTANTSFGTPFVAASTSQDTTPIMWTFNTSSSGTLYLKAKSTFSVGTCVGYGSLTMIRIS